MEDYKNVVLPPGHIVEVTYDKMKMKLYSKKSVTLSVVVRKATKADST